MDVTFDRIRAAVLALAADSTPLRVQKLMTFFGILIDEAALTPSTFAAWLAGSLVIDFRRRDGSTTFAIVVDDGRTFVDLFSCDLPFISFDAVTHFAERDPATLGGGFVLLSSDLVSVAVLQEIELEDELAEAPRPAEPDAEATEETLVMSRWDLDATVVRAPSPDLLVELAARSNRPSL